MGGEGVFESGAGSGDGWLLDGVNDGFVEVVFGFDVGAVDFVDFEIAGELFVFEFEDGVERFVLMAVGDVEDEGAVGVVGGGDIQVRNGIGGLGFVSRARLRISRGRRRDSGWRRAAADSKWSGGTGLCHW